MTMKLIDTLKQILFRFGGFSLIGIGNTLLSMLIILVMNEVCGINAMISYVFAYVTTVFLAYIANARLVFHAKISILSGMGFFASYLSGMMLGMALLWLSARLLPGWNATLVSYAVIPVTMLWNFILINRILGEKKRNKDGKEKKEPTP